MKNIIQEFNIGDKVYMDSPFGRYEGVVMNIADKEMKIKSESPTGNGTMWAFYPIKQTNWKKYQNK
jgi:hypothetical protein